MSSQHVHGEKRLHKQWRDQWNKGMRAWWKRDHAQLEGVIRQKQPGDPVRTALLEQLREDRQHARRYSAR